MRRLALGAFSAFILWFAVDGVLAEEKDESRNITRQNGPTAEAGYAKQEPNQPVGEPNQQPGARGMSADQQQRIIESRQNTEELRRQARQQIRERAEERRRQAIEGGRTADANVSARIKDRDKSKVDSTRKPTTEGVGFQQQLETMEQMMSQEQAKHRDRLARLNRIHELAQEQGDTETVARVDKLLEQEKQRYEAKTLRIQRRKDRVAEFMERAEMEKTKKADIADANKDVNQPAVEKK